MSRAGRTGAQWYRHTPAARSAQKRSAAHTVSGCLLPPSRMQHSVTFGDESGPTATGSCTTHRTPSNNTGLSDAVRGGSPTGLPAEPSRTKSTDAHASRPQRRPTSLTSVAARVCLAGTAENSTQRPHREKLPRSRRAVRP
ncbi:hypothetical protein NDU88_004868 [Pleurodeles waltl]|uniref:Uncharacterized protein n=1 Tax=Pleurodeles waltl TaxID=8319 RepID=A0AAV7L2N8_PLEWA|nr:hypothetical protein NDU88_004868 [Pleurodeles waltl]